MNRNMFPTSVSGSLRPTVIVSSLISAVWALVWAVGAFRSVSIDNDHGEPKLAMFCIVLGALYIATMAIELLGIAGAASQRPPLVKLYALLSVVAGCMVIGASLLRVIIHFSLKDDLISECTQLATGTTVFYEFGLWTTQIDDDLSPSEAASYCNNAWKHDSFSEILALIFQIVLSTLSSAVAFAYANQVRGPAPAAFPGGVPVPAAGGSSSAYPAHYNPPYLGYDAPPPAAAADDAEYEPPVYSEAPGAYAFGGDGKDSKERGANPFDEFDEVSVQDQDRDEKRDGSREALV